MADLVSVLLPVFNGAAFLNQAVESLLAQSYKDLEIIAVDDGSTDGSVEILQAYAASDRRFRFFQNEVNLGLFANYNRCMELAQGSYIKPFAQDDILYSDCISKACGILSSRPEVSLVLTGKDLLDQDGGIKPAPCLNKEGILRGKDLITWSLILLDNRLGEPVVGMFRAKDKGYGYDTRYFHFGDLEFWFRLLERGDLYFINERLCAFRFHSGATTVFNHRHLRDILDGFRLGHQYFDYLSAIGETKEHFQKRLIEFAALQVDHLVREQGLDLDSVRRTPPETIPGGTLNLADDFAQVLFLSLRYLTPTLSELDHLKRCREKDHDNFQKEIDKIHASISWKVTAPLRAIRKPVKAIMKD